MLVADSMHLVSSVLGSLGALVLACTWTGLYLDIPAEVNTSQGSVFKYLSNARP